MVELTLLNGLNVVNQFSAKGLPIPHFCAGYGHRLAPKGVNMVLIIVY